MPSDLVFVAQQASSVPLQCCFFLGGKKCMVVTQHTHTHARTVLPPLPLTLVSHTVLLHVRCVFLCVCVCLPFTSTALRTLSPIGFYCSGGAKSSMPVDGESGGRCPAGSYCPPGSASPSPCPEGTFSNSTGTHETHCNTQHRHA